MRLLRYREDGQYGAPTRFSPQDFIPKYAILSHTWGSDSDEVTLEDLENGVGPEKSGYDKIRLCGDQAHRDGMEYFWIDTCCIDKRDKAETSLAIRSMFRWYRHAPRCYVYLSDVSIQAHERGESTASSLWESKFRKSRWFTRGWTLQELLAPASVDFFSKEWVNIGDKVSLIQQVHEATNISPSALQGASLSRFTVNERLSWNEHRDTRLPVDKVYSSMGILGVEISPFPDETPAEAHRRVMDEISNQNKCLQDLQTTDPYFDKQRIQETKGRLFKDAYRWVFSNASFQQWQNCLESQLLWIKGDPGKGKTMLLCGIIDELQMLVDKPALLSYFFCQATDDRINSATSVLRGILGVIFDQQPWLTSHVRKRYDLYGKALFEDANAWVALSNIFEDIMKDPNLGTTYVIIDALDECVKGLPSLLQLIQKQSATSARIKWIVSSRNWPNIEEGLSAASKVQLSLELNCESVSKAVRIFIEQRVESLSQQKRYDAQTRDSVLDRLVSKADDTFLWVALVCQELEKTSKRHVLKRLDLLPPGLNSLYERMMQNINESEDAEVCIQILKVAALVNRPVTLKELIALVEQLEDMVDDLDTVREILCYCSSFLTLRGGTIFFVHQTAQDFLRAATPIYPLGVKHHHHIIFSRSLTILSKTLRRDLYEIEALGTSIDDIKRRDPDPLESLRYCCVYWIEHLSASASLTLSDDCQIVNEFLQTKYLYWLEALSLYREIASVIISLAKLQSLFQETTHTELTGKIHDAQRFLWQFQKAIHTSPLQVYVSALFFSPTQSLIKRLFYCELPKWITIRSNTDKTWSACLRTLEGHITGVCKVLFSPNGTILASVSWNRVVKLWNVRTGICIRTLEDCDLSFSIAISQNSRLLAMFKSVGLANQLEIWDINSGIRSHFAGLPGNALGLVFLPSEKLLLAVRHGHKIMLQGIDGGKVLQTFNCKTSIDCVHFSSEGRFLAAVSYAKHTIQIWNVDSGECLRTFETAITLVFSPDSQLVLIQSTDRVRKVFVLSSGEELVRLPIGPYDAAMAFSPDNKLVALGDSETEASLWTIGHGEYLQSLEVHTDFVRAISFAPHEKLLATGSSDNTIKLWDLKDSSLQAVKDIGDESIVNMTFSPNGAFVASELGAKKIKLWDACSGECLHTLPGRNCLMGEMTFSDDSKRLFSRSGDYEINIWDVKNGKRIGNLSGNQYGETVRFSPDGLLVATADIKMIENVTLWDCSNGKKVHTLAVQYDPPFRSHVPELTFSHDGKLLASGRGKGPVNLFDVYSGKRLQIFENDGFLSAITFSPRSEWLAVASLDSLSDAFIKIWSCRNGTCLQTLRSHKIDTYDLAFTDDGKYVAAASSTSTVQILAVDSGVCLQNFTNLIKSVASIRSMRFNSSASLIETNYGSFTVQKAVDGSIAVIDEPQSPQFVGANLSADGTWVKDGEKNFLWIPPEYRSSRYAVWGNKIAVGTKKGQVWICRTRAEV